MIHQYSNLLSIFDSINTLKIILIAFVLISIIFALVYIKEFRIPALIVFSVAITFVAGISAYKTYNYLSAHSMSIGDVINSVVNRPTSDIGDYTEDSPLIWTYKTLGFEYDSNNNTYLTSITLPNNNNLNLKEDTKYLYLNNTECLTTILHDERVLKSEYKYQFFKDDSLLKEDTLFITIYDYEKYDKIVITSKGNSDAINLWKAFQNKFGFTIELKDDSTYVAIPDLGSDCLYPLSPNVYKFISQNDISNQFANMVLNKPAEDGYMFSITSDCLVNGVVEYIEVNNFGEKSLCFVKDNGEYMYLEDVSPDSYGHTYIYKFGYFNGFYSMFINERVPGGFNYSEDIVIFALNKENREKFEKVFNKYVVGVYSIDKRWTLPVYSFSDIQVLFATYDNNEVSIVVWSYIDSDFIQIEFTFDMSLTKLIKTTASVNHDDKIVTKIS